MRPWLIGSRQDRRRSSPGFSTCVLVGSQATASYRLCDALLRFSDSNKVPLQEAGWFAALRRLRKVWLVEWPLVVSADGIFTVPPPHRVPACS